MQTKRGWFDWALFGAAVGWGMIATIIVLAWIPLGSARIVSPARLPLALIVVPVVGGATAIMCRAVGRSVVAVARRVRPPKPRPASSLAHG